MDSQRFTPAFGRFEPKHFPRKEIWQQPVARCGAPRRSAAPIECGAEKNPNTLCYPQRYWLVRLPTSAAGASRLPSFQSFCSQL